MMTDSFEELLGRARANDPSAAEELFTRLGSEAAEGKELLRLIRKLVPATDRARAMAQSADFLQSALCAGWVDLSSFRGQSKSEFYGWLRTIVRRKIARAVTRRGAMKFDEEIGQLDWNPGEDSPPIDLLIQYEATQRLQRAISQLEPEQQVVIRASLKGTPTADLAKDLNLSPEAIRKRRSRAARILRDALGPEA